MYRLPFLHKQAHEQVATKKLSLSFFHVRSVVIKAPKLDGISPKRKGVLG